jgi:hypothetical protein
MSVFIKVYVITLFLIEQSFYNICNYYYDKSLDATIGTLDLINPFQYDEKLWGKNIVLEIPSIYSIAKDRNITSNENNVIPNTIIYNLTNGVGLSQSSPIFIDFSYITTTNNINIAPIPIALTLAILSKI